MDARQGQIPGYGSPWERRPPGPAPRPVPARFAGPPPVRFRPAPRPKRTRPTLVCWLRATAADGVRFDLRRAPDAPGVMTPLRGAFGPEQAITVAGLLGRRGWRDVQVIRRRLDDPTPPVDMDGTPPEPEILQTRFVRLNGQRLLATEVAPPPAIQAARRGALLASNGDWTGARDALREAVSHASATPAVWRSLGIAQGRCGEWRYARRALEQAITLGDEPAIALLAEVQRIEQFTRATQRRAWDASAHRQLGLLLMAWERGDEALYHLERAAALAPRDIAAHMALGLEMLCRSRWDDAAAVYSTALTLATDDEQRVAAEEGLALARAGRLPDQPTTTADVWEELLVAG